MPSHPRFIIRASLAALIGLPGVAILPFVLRVPEGVPIAAVVLNPLILLTLAALAGAWAAPRVGLTSVLILGSAGWLHVLLIWAVFGVILGAAVAATDHATAMLWKTGNVLSLREGRDATALALGLLYGGMTEEVLLRWGMMSLLALGLLRFFARPVALWLAIVIAAAIFAAAHIPAAAIEAGTMSTALLARTLFWNGLLGIIYGAAFTRDGLEAAILAHMATHVGFAIVGL